MTTPFVLQDGAADDLRSIVRYTRKTWGEVQARAYSETLHTGIQRLVNGQGTYKILEDIHPALRITRCEHHYIFCLCREDAPSLIVAILHERMDLIARITDRLD
ncbi:type II toxin-antitoxin system RelE/ParE family toxin [Asticcacaulis sp.]|uniref:type II toxin-antitoxin system RelE/ParE family toxin n=1 Tax=Asticcacaulis sp. TaxID=1872648 RepID=UPI002C9E3035|nr:type II toxin-antitoxin system RelE/ParE family toxin [Asticcacaulis sp.]HTM82694.1 type II toxin-antitoxin system RelE/ParE family toxin [Asticcacaulis sp.]